MKSLPADADVSISSFDYYSEIKVIVVRFPLRSTLIYTTHQRRSKMATYEEHVVKYSSNGEKEILYIEAGPLDGPLLIFIHGWPGIAATWKPQLNIFAQLGFRVVAPDMPGYGRSTVTKVTEDYSHEVIVPGLLAMLNQLGRDKAIWFGHDWGAGVVSSLVATNPQVCTAACFICVPYRTIEMGKDEMIKYSNREIYPEDEYPYAQWSYQEFYEHDFEKAVSFHESDSAAMIKGFTQKGDPSGYLKPALTSNVVKDGGWLGGLAKPPAEFRDIPDEKSVYAAGGHLKIRDELISAMEKTGWWAGDSYYMNHARNRAFNMEKSINGGVLEFPVLFIGATWDHVCDTKNSRLSEPMRRHCKNLTETRIDGSHFVAIEKAEETNAAIARWLVQEVASSWPGYWKNGFVKTPRA